MSIEKALVVVLQLVAIDCQPELEVLSSIEVQLAFNKEVRLSFMEDLDIRLCPSANVLSVECASVFDRH